MTRRPIQEQTRIVHGGAGAGPIAATVNPPLQRGSTVLASCAAALYDNSELTYGRGGLSPHDQLRAALAELEGAAGTCLYPSGLAAMTGALLALLRAGDEVLAVDCVYDPTRRFCDTHLKRYGVTTRYVDPRLPASELVAQASERTRVIVLESPGSLTFEIQDTPAIAAAARERGVLTVIDGTYGAGVLDKPLALGVDVCVQALTKYVGGHADVFMGSASARDAALLKRLQDSQLQIGWATSPDDAYLMLRGLRTLPVRLARHGESAVKVAAWLQSQPEVREVLCPALPGARGHELWKRDFRGVNGLFSIVLQPAPETAVLAFLDALELFGLGFSWGGFESLAIHCDPQFGRRTIRPEFEGPLVRLHVGLEAVDDLIADLRGGLDAFSAAR